MQATTIQPPAVDHAKYAVTGKQYPHWVGSQGYTITKSAEHSTTVWRVFYIENGQIRSLSGYSYSLKNARDRANQAGDLTK